MKHQGLHEIPQQDNQQPQNQEFLQLSTTFKNKIYPSNNEE